MNTVHLYSTEAEAQKALASFIASNTGARGYVSQAIGAWGFRAHVSFAGLSYCL